MKQEEEKTIASGQIICVLCKLIICLAEAMYRFFVVVVVAIFTCQRKQNRTQNPEDRRIKYSGKWVTKIQHK